MRTGGRRRRQEVRVCVLPLLPVLPTQLPVHPAQLVLVPWQPVLLEGGGRLGRLAGGSGAQPSLYNIFNG